MQQRHSLALASLVPVLFLSLAAPASAAGAPGYRIKLACPARAAASHPCRAVWLRGNDGTRRLFPTAAIYNSWFPNFSGIRTVSTRAMNALPLGEPMAMKPAPTPAAPPAGTAPIAGAAYEYKKVTTARGAFDVHVVTLDRAKFKMKTYDAAAADCAGDCATKPLMDYVSAAGAQVGIHGSYFCPKDYADCAGKVGSFLWPLYDSGNGQMRNASAIPLHQAPLLAESADGKLVYYPRAPSFGSVAAFQSAQGSPLDAAIANYPGLVDGGSVIVESEPRLDDGQRTKVASRGALGWNGDKFYLAIAPKATVVDMAYVMQSLGATEALNLDGGGSSALVFGGKYKVGPGRTLPNAVVFVAR